MAKIVSKLPSTVRRKSDSGLKGARSLSAVTNVSRLALSQGKIPSKTLMEALAIDFAILLRTLHHDFTDAELQPILSVGISEKMRLSAQLLGDKLGIANAIELCAAHASDTVRGFACYLIALGHLQGADVLKAIQPLAVDSHFGVREWAWLAVRPTLTADLENSISVLRTWAVSEDANQRRFASEAIRPRGVWCKHIEALKREPQLALCLLEPLRSDPVRYVQDSVANWLNDASKDQPAWVRDLCQRWLRESSVAVTQYICKRAQRSIKSS